MGKEVSTFGDIEAETHKFHHHKNLILLDDVDICWMMYNASKN